MVTLAEMVRYAEYQESGVEWLGNIPEHWMLKKFKHHYASAMGETILASDLKEDGVIPVYSATEGNHFFGYVEKSNILLDNGDLVIPARGNSIGFPKLVNSVSTCSQTTIYARVVKEIDQKFTYYYLLGCKPYLFQFVQTAIPQITVNEVSNNWLVFPPLSEQASIANFLTKKTAQIDDAISIKEQQVVLLKERKQIIIQKAVTQGLNPKASMKYSGVDWIGQIPEHWEIFANRALFSERVQPGREGLPLLSVSIHSGVSSEEISDEENIRGRVKIEDKTKYILVKPGDIAFNMMRAWQGGIGAVSTEGMVSPAYIVAKPKTYINAEYFENQYRCPEFIQQMDRFSKGITDFRKRLYWDGFKQLNTVLPPVKEQLDVVKFIKLKFPAFQ
ncbi:MAG: hypothetical protein BA863_04675 [Desulfovibrio sp. S3730MH75]|nr:MAG: hypothetical protein BA863_04675 [Desulfovibrio sp. S3730MH75]